MVAESIVHLLEVVEIDHQQGGFGFHTAGALERKGEAVKEEAAVGQAGELVVEGEVLVVFDLVFEEEQDHADGYDILGEVPDLVFDLRMGRQGIRQGARGRRPSPSRESR